MPAFITLLGPSSTLKGLWVYYPWQGIPDQDNPLGPFEVVPYQWTIRAHSLNRPGAEVVSCTVSEVLLQNSYSGIDFSAYGARHVLQHIWGQPLREGIRIGNCFDIGRIIDVHFWPFWDHGADQKRRDPSVSTVFRDFTAARGFALVLFKSDMQIVHDFFAFGYFVGVHLGFQKQRNEATGHEWWGACTGQFSNLNLDQCTNGIDFHSTDKSGVQVTNANIVCRDLPCINPTVSDPLARHAIVAHNYPNAHHEDIPLPGGFLAIRGASIFGFTNHSMVAWETRNNTLMISSSWFRNEADPDPRKCGPVTAPLIDVVRGRAIIQGNWFQRYNGGAAVQVGSEGEAAIITGNISEGHSFPNPSAAIIVNDNILLP
jgi:hypothetical protein